MYCLISHSKPDCSDGGAALFLAGVDHGCCEKRQKWTRRYLQDTAVSLKKGDFNTPSVFSFFKRKRRSEICYFKTAVRLLVFCLGAQIASRQNNGFFIIPLGGCFYLDCFEFSVKISNTRNYNKRNGPNIAIPIGKKPEYIVPSNPKTRPCIEVSVFSCSIVVIAVCTIVNATP